MRDDTTYSDKNMYNLLSLKVCIGQY